MEKPATGPWPPVYASEALMPLLMKELQSAHYYSSSLTQVANVACLPGIVGVLPCTSPMEVTPTTDPPQRGCSTKNVSGSRGTVLPDLPVVRPVW